MIFLLNKINFVGDKLLPVFKHGFLRSEENVFPAIFLHTKCVWENIFIYNFDYLCMVGSITIHVGRCYWLVISNTLVFVVDVIALADVIAMFCVLFLLLRLMFLLGKHFLQTWGSHIWKLAKACLLQQNWSCSREITYYITKTRWEVYIYITWLPLQCKFHYIMM